jgi:hypothetical protein
VKGLPQERLVADMPRRPKPVPDPSKRLASPAVETPLRHLLALSLLPGTLTAEQVAQRIGCHNDDIPCLQSLLVSLGNPGEKAVKRYLTREVLEFLEDRNRMDCFWSAVYRRNRQRNIPQMMPKKQRPASPSG